MPEENVSFVRGLYRSILKREPDAEGLAFWIHAMGKPVRDGGGRKNVETAFRKSMEARMVVVEQHLGELGKLNAT